MAARVPGRGAGLANDPESGAAQKRGGGPEEAAPQVDRLAADAHIGRVKAVDGRRCMH
jgi:hypothetical protein